MSATCTPVPSGSVSSWIRPGQFHRFSDSPRDPVKGVMAFGPTKGHERREVPLPRFLLEDRARQTAARAADDLLFTGGRGAVMRSQTFQRAALTAAAEALGIAGFHP